MSVDILNVGSGNIQSVKNWIDKANISVRVVDQASDIKSSLLILPGVGSAGPYMKRLKKGKFDQAILKHVDKGGRLLGICLGFQIMSAYSEEDGGVEGFIAPNGIGTIKENSTGYKPEEINLLDGGAAGRQAPGR